jgi:Cu+-exporting ATPase
VPPDGVVVKGSIAVDEKAITGESLPRERTVGERVLAASVAVHGQAEILVERAGSDTTAARIVQIIEGAGAKPMTLQENVERHANRLVVPTFAIAGLAYAASGMIDRFASVIITDFGTGVRVAIPTTALASMTLSARRGVLVKGAQYLERLNEVDTVVFDKTGTLTRGAPEVTDVLPLQGTEAELLLTAAQAEQPSEHPLGQGVVRAARQRGFVLLPPGRFEALPGAGVRARVQGQEALVGHAALLRAQGVDVARAEPEVAKLQEQGKTALLVAHRGQLLGVLGLADEVRPEAEEAVRAVHGLGLRTLLLTGDHPRTAQRVARRVGIADVVAEVKPADKAARVRGLQEQGRVVAMVGDGVNDAPALAQADVGIAIGGGSDVAMEAGDLVLLRSDPRGVADSIALSRATMRKIRGNLAWAFAYNVALVPVAALGLLHPALAGLAMALSSVTVVGNALLLRRWRPTTAPQRA